MNKTIICLGTRACDIGEVYEALSEPVDVKLIDEEIEGENCLSIPKYRTAEEYEKNTPDASAFFADAKEEILFIVAGGSGASNCSLKLLQQLRGKKIDIVYLKPQLEFLTKNELLQERVVRNVLQEYTRSALFERMVLIDEQEVENNLLNDISISEYDSSLIHTIRQLIGFYFNLPLQSFIIDQINPPKATSRIVSLGYYDLGNDEENMCYNMSMVTEKEYYFFLSEASLSNKKLFREVKEKIKHKAINDVEVSYAIAKTTVSDFCFVVNYTNKTEQ